MSVLRGGIGYARRGGRPRLWSFVREELLSYINERRSKKRSGFYNKAFPNADWSILEALQYELYRLDDGDKLVSRDDLDIAWSRHENIQTNHAAALMYLLQNHVATSDLCRLLSEQGLHRLSEQLEHFGVEARKLVRTERFADVMASNVRANWERFSVPAEMTPTDAKALSSKIFAYRWCHLMAYRLGVRQQGAIACYESIRETVIHRFDQSEVENWPTFIRKSHPRPLAGNDPDPDEIKAAIKAADIFSNFSHRGWVLLLMHADYAAIIDWQQLSGEEELPLLAKFVVDVLGVHLLRARYQKKWSWKRQYEKWDSSLKPGRAKALSLPLVEAGDSQPVKIDGNYYAFDYIQIIRPKAIKRLKPIIVSPIELLR